MTFLLLDLGDSWVKSQAVDLFGEAAIDRFVAPRRAAADGGCRRLPPFPYLDAVAFDVAEKFFAERAPHLRLAPAPAADVRSLVIGAFGGFDVLQLPPLREHQHAN